MTTIAWDGRHLAADTREVWDKSIPTLTRKIEILSNDLIIGYAGSSFAYSEVKDLFLGKRTEVSKETSKISEAIVLIKGVPYNWAGTDLKNLVKIYTPPHAIGSGWKYAWAFMKLGMNAMAAIKQTESMDIFTNSIVDHYDTKQKRLILSRFPTPEIENTV